MTKAIAIDLFCGVGGLTYGLRAAGIKVVAGVDSDATCQYAYETNNRESTFVHGDVADVKLMEELKELYASADIKILAGCAPCQPFSKHTQKNKEREKDRKWSLLDYFLRAINMLNPDVISMENVPQLAHQSIFKNFENSLLNRQEKYFLTSDTYNCVDYGVPQSRNRLVLIGSKFGPIEMVDGGYKKNPQFVRDAIGNLEPIQAGEISTIDRLHRCRKLSPINLQRIRQSKPGGTWRDWDEDLLAECHKRESGRSYSSVYSRMLWDAPSPTITTQFHSYGTGRFGHPDTNQDRAISLREGALLQSFPNNYAFFDPNLPDKKISMEKIGIHIGNAVPVKLAEAVGRSIMLHVNKHIIPEYE